MVAAEDDREDFARSATPRLASELRLRRCYADAFTWIATAQGVERLIKQEDDPVENVLPQEP